MLDLSIGCGNSFFKGIILDSGTLHVERDPFGYEWISATVRLVWIEKYRVSLTLI